MDAERSLTRRIDAIARRARLVLAAEAAGWGAVAAVLSLPVGAFVAVLIAAWRSVRASRAFVVLRADRTAAASNVIVTADELLRGALQATPQVRARVVNEASRLLGTASMRNAIPIMPAVRSALIAAVCWSLFAAYSATHDRVRTPGPDNRPRGVSASAPVSSLHLSVTASPPGYTALPPVSVDDPSELRLVQGTRISVRTSREAAIAHDGRASDPTFVAEKTGYLAAATADGVRRLVPIVVTPDNRPVVRIDVPGRDLVFADASPRIDFEVHATDDFGLRSLALSYTRVTGSGEEYTFGEGEVPLSIVKRSAREWVGTASRTLTAFGLEEGGTIVYKAVASDWGPGQREADSDAYFIEISRLGVSAGDAFTLPREETRYALSEQMLIVKTERLNRQRASMPAGDYAEACLTLAVEQRAIRAEFVFMLGGEVEDEEIEAEQSIEVQAGRLANRGQRDLRDATRAMSAAEKLLTGVDAPAALTAERTAVTALQRAFARDRYLLRALASRSSLDPARRLTGDRSGARDVRTPVPSRPENRRAARLQDLLEGVGALARDAAAGTAIDSGRAAVLAETALRIDADSSALRGVAADLDRRAWEAALAAVAGELRRVLAAAPPTLTFTAPALQQALDAARGGRR